MQFKYSKNKMSSKKTKAALEKELKQTQQRLIECMQFRDKIAEIANEIIEHNKTTSEHASRCVSANDEVVQQYKQHVLRDKCTIEQLREDIKLIKSSYEKEIKDELMTMDELNAHLRNFGDYTRWSMVSHLTKKNGNSIGLNGSVPNPTQEDL